jgi:uncharacterized membrane protein YqiK
MEMIKQFEPIILLAILLIVVLWFFGVGKSFRA